MPSTSSLIQTLSAAHPEYTFTEASDFFWDPNTKTVHYSPAHPNAPALLLHELAHGLLAHAGYERDVALLSMEAAAWETATQLGAKYGVPVSDATIQDHLDTYRDWMHARSTCPDCTATGYQTAPAAYTCPACSHVWRVNEARVCGLKRYSTT